MLPNPIVIPQEGCRARCDKEGKKLTFAYQE